MPNSQRLAVVAGTTVPAQLGPIDYGLQVLPNIALGRLKIGGVKLSLISMPRVRIARPLYSQFASLSEDSKVFALKRLGLVHAEETYEALRPQLLKFAEGGLIDIIGDSQGGYPAVRFAKEFPDLVGHLILLSVPLQGTPVATWARNAGLDFAGVRCMEPGSRYVERVSRDFEFILDLADGPRVTCMSSGHDFLVPRASALYRVDSSSRYCHHPHLSRICLHHTELLDEGVELVKVWDGRFRMHLTEVFLRHTGHHVSKVLAKPSRDAKVHLVAA